eukprot:CAMPEP_0176426684 /NCGR_PEP_ID=MMETSP0127-20121128/12092_1 /TAXON_ID=938130 /ORGANISM="Platyophrya macrostoma, Strain WH" /LENGTH=61 /DNA_ID=CAMNT_0017808005 /DNA_START=94 /DNA_END=276 /DNA_ORIENTATION=-
MSSNCESMKVELIFTFEELGYSSLDAESSVSFFVVAVRNLGLSVCSTFELADASAIGEMKK